MDLVRAILLHVERSPVARLGTDDVSIAGYESSLIREHIRLLSEGGFLGGVSNTLGDGTVRFVSLHITWKGYEFLDAARDKSIWERTKTLLKDKAGPVPFEILKTLLTKAVAMAVGLEKWPM